MKCRHLFSFVLVVFLSLFFGSFITISDTFAIDDFVLNIDESNYSSFLFGSYLCGSDSSVNCSDYSYYIVEPINVSSLPSNSRFQARFMPGGQFVSFSFPVMSQMVIPYNNSVTTIQLTNAQSLYEHSFSFRVILSNSLPGSSTPPSGNIDITSNGTYDVTNYAQATVNVPAEVIQGDYHDDLVNINQSIIVCGAILLVLYFFYCIYRLIIKNSGVH